MKIAITGSNGKVGKPVVAHLLNEGHAVLALDNADEPELAVPLSLNLSKFTYRKADLTDFDILLDLLKGCDAVIALAALPNPTDYKVATHNNNIVISWNILRACAELGITRIAQASSVNVLTLAYSQTQHYEYFPIDEAHPCTPDEPYGLSKVIMETQADTIVRRYPTMRIASLRLHYSVPDRQIANTTDEKRKKDLWGYVHEDSAADAFLLAVAQDTANGQSETLWRTYWPNVKIKKGHRLTGKTSFFDCSKAGKMMGWIHRDGLNK
ncbi:NAD-binding protein [Cyathus striatus]|nr:NAD-binding protein [Cyathus striatus]